MVIYYVGINDNSVHSTPGRSIHPYSVKLPCGTWWSVVQAYVYSRTRNLCKTTSTAASWVLCEVYFMYDVTPVSKGTP